MNVHSVNEQNKVARLYEKQTRTENGNATISGVALSQAVSFVKGEDLGVLGNNAYSAVPDNDKKPKTAVEVADEATVLKNNMKAICNKMDVGEMVELDDGEVDLGDTEVDKIVTVGEQIRIKLAAAGNERVYTGDLDSDVVREVLGEVSQMAVDSLIKYNYPVTDENIEEIEKTVDIAKELEVPGTSAKAYLLNNSLEPTLENLYMAEHSGNYENVGKGLSDKEWDSLVPQIEGLLENENINSDELVLGEIRELIDDGVAITGDNLAAYERLNEAAVFVEGLTSKDVPTSREYTKNLVDKIVATLVDMEPAMKVNLSNRDVTWVRALKLMEARANMSFEAAYIMEKNNAGVDLSQLSELIDEISAANMAETVNLAGTINLAGTAINGTMAEADLSFIADSADHINNNGSGNIQDIQDSFQGFVRDFTALRSTPCDAIGRAVEEPSLGNLEEKSFALQSEYDRAGKAYETMQTEVRPDLGDRIDKAISASTQYILKELDLEMTYENQRAVNILAHNSMEISIENMTKVKAIDGAVNNLFEKMTPDVVLDMLRDRVDVLGMNIEELSKEVDRRKEEKDVVVSERFGEFLYRLNHRGEISEEEREQFMGFYTIVNKLTKDKGKAAGLLARSDKEETLGNMVTAYMSKNDAGMNMAVDNGSLSDNSRHAEHNNAKLTYYKQLLSDMAKVPGEASELVTENNLPQTINNIMAAGAFVKDKSVFFKALKDDREDARLDHFLESMDSKEELVSTYEELAGHVNEMIKNFAGSTKGADYRALKQLGCGMSILGNLSRNNTFYIPYDSDDRSGAIKLTVVESSTVKGNFGIDMDTEEFGHVKINATVSETTIVAEIYTRYEDSSLDHIKDMIERNLKKLGFEEITLEDKSSVNILEKGVESKQSTRSLFAAAKVFIECFR